jgi:hypothetical protein
VSDRAAPRALDDDGEALLGGDPSGIGDDRRLVGSGPVTGAQAAEARIGTRQQAETHVEVGLGTVEERPHVVADHDDHVGRPE